MSQASSIAAEHSAVGHQDGARILSVAQDAEIFDSDHAFVEFLGVRLGGVKCT